MRMSCNGCRVLRKGCSEDCIIRPCLQWIKNPESQGNATVFLAKFYGRAGLLNLINAGPDHLRPAIFRSLLYEACGRIVNPIYGSVGLLWSGNWQLCQAAVEAVLKGAPVIQIPSDKAADDLMPHLKSFDIRHVAKDENRNRGSGPDLHKVAKTTRTRFKRSGDNNCGGDRLKDPKSAPFEADQRWRQLSHDSSSTPDCVPAVITVVDRENESMFSGETIDAFTVTNIKRSITNFAVENGNVELELTLGSSPSRSSTVNAVSPACSGSPQEIPSTAWRDTENDRVDLALHLTA